MGLFDFLMNKPSKEALAEEEFKRFTENLELKGGVMEPIEVSLALEKDEYGYLEAPAELHELQTITTYTPAIRFRYRLVKGVYMTGGTSQKFDSYQKPRFINEGTLTITNKRLVFTGKRRRFARSTDIIIPLTNIAFAEHYTDGFVVFFDVNANSTCFAVSCPMLWRAMYEIHTRTGLFGSTVA